MLFMKFARNPVVLIAIIFSVIYGFPHLIMLYYNGALYNPVPVENAGASALDEYPYAINLREAVDGNLIVRNAQLAGHKEDAGILDFFPSAFWGVFASIFQLNVFQVLIFLDFLMPAASFAALFLFANKIFKLERKLSILASVLILVFNSFVYLATSILTLNIRYFDFTKSTDMFSTIPRFHSPEFTFIMLLASLAALYATFKKDNFLSSKKPLTLVRSLYQSISYPLLTAIGGTLLTYSYFIYSSFFWVACAVFSFLMVLRRRQNLIKAALIFIPSILLSIPYLLNYLQLNKSTAYADLLSRVIVLHGRLVYSQLIHTAFSLALLFLIYLLIFRRDKFRFYFLASIVLGGIIISNIQVITGFTVQPDHWITRIMDPMYFILVAIILQESREALRSTANKSSLLISKALGFFLNKKTLYFAMSASLLFVFSYNVFFALNAHQNYRFSPAEADLYNWLSKNTPKDSTVLTLSIKENSHISYATHDSVYLPNGFINVIPSEEIIDRILFAHRIFNVSDGELLAKLNVSNDALRLEYMDKLADGTIFSSYDFERYYFIHYFFHAQFFYGNRPYTQQNPDHPGWIGYYFPIAFREYVMEKYRSGNFTEYGYDYILIGPYERQIADVNKIERDYTKVYSNSEFEVFTAA